MYTRRVVVLLGVLGCLTACGPRLETVETIDEFGFKERYQRHPEDFRREGLYERLNPEGTVVEQATYHQDTLAGQRVLFYDNRDTQIVEHYVGGNFVGDYRQYYPGGALKQVGNYVAGSMQGSWKLYHPNGQLAEDVMMVDNVEHGPFREWYPDGQPKAVGTYRDGDNEHGRLVVYDEDGQVNRVMECDMGVCRSIWKRETANGTPPPIHNESQ